MAAILEWVAAALKSTLSVREVVTVLGIAGVVWLMSGLTLRGRMLAGWLAVPILVAAACFFVAGQEHLFPNLSFEGPRLIRVGYHDSIVMSDLIGLTFAAAACLLALTLLWRRLAVSGARRGGTRSEFPGTGLPTN